MCAYLKTVIKNKFLKFVPQKRSCDQKIYGKNTTVRFVCLVDLGQKFMFTSHLLILTLTVWVRALLLSSIQ